MNFIASIRGIVCLLLLSINALVIPTTIILIALLRYLLPISSWRHWCYRLMSYLSILWVDGNLIILRLLTRIQWKHDGIDRLDSSKWYFLISNHRSWVDILVLHHVFNRKAPPLKFFLKQQLIWVPGIGLACKALQFPFMQRYSKSYLKKHPEKKGKDIEATRRSCTAFKLHPSIIILFPETTRFTQAKKRNQNSPYQHLLRPKGSMLALSLSILGDHVTQLVDVTIVYDNPTVTLWDLLCGRIKRIYTHVNCIPIPNSMLTQLDNETELRKQTQQWLTTLWEAKDQQLQSIFTNKV